MDRTYAGSFGRLRVLRQDFLSEEFIIGLMDKTTDEVIQSLSTTTYREDLDALSAFSSGTKLIEMAINRHLIKKNRQAMQAPPPAARKFLETYFSKWDIENIKTIISAKFLGYELKETEDFIMSFRDVPSGIFGGRMSREEFRALMNLGSVEAVVENISRMPFGLRAMQAMDQYRKTNDVSFIFTSMDNFYLSDVMSSLKFYNGDEGAVRRYFREQIDLKNILFVLKAREFNLSVDLIKAHFVSGGTIPDDALEEIFRQENVAEATKKASELIIQQQARQFSSLVDFEIAARRAIYQRSIDYISYSALSLNSIFAFILTSEMEREALRATVLGISLGVPRERLLSIVANNSRSG